MNNTPSYGSFKRFLVVQDHDGFSDLQEPGIVELSPVLHTSPTNGNVEAPRAINPVFHTYPMYLQINPRIAGFSPVLHTYPTIAIIGTIQAEGAGLQVMALEDICFCTESQSPEIPYYLGRN